MKSAAYALVALALLNVPAFAMKNRQRNFLEPCPAVWTAAVAVAKSQQYRIVSINKEEQIISVAAGGVWSGERMLTLTLEPGPERGCLATVQSAFSGLAHSDAPDLLARVGVELIGQTVDRDSKPFRKLKACVEDSYTSDSKCEQKFRKAQNLPEPKDSWQNTPKPGSSK